MQVHRLALGTTTGPRAGGRPASAFLIALLIAAVALLGCDKKTTSPGDGATWDIDAKGIPKFVNTNYIDLDAIARISRFRSAYGHDYSHDDAVETCRSMKHYFWPTGGNPGEWHSTPWVTIPIASPVRGTVAKLAPEFEGTQIWITSRDYPAFEFRIFHVGLTLALAVGDTVGEGQVLGHHGGDGTMSDIAVRVSTPNGWRLISCFDVMTDFLFQSFQTRGIASRAELIITKEDRDADPLTCSGETFTSAGQLPNWVDLTAGGE